MKKNIIYNAILVALCLFGCYFIYTKEMNKKNLLSHQYKELNKDNLYQVMNEKEAVKFLKEGSGIIYFSFPECPWCQAYIEKLNNIAKEINADKIYYVNILNSRKENTKEYQELVEILKKELPNDDKGNKRIFVPMTVVTHKGKVIWSTNETSMITKEENKDPKTYWTEDKLKELKKNIEVAYKSIPKTCTDCNK